ncbi:MAG: hypothetical protein AABY00_01650 [Nanoarchaeota archaeon]
MDFKEITTPESLKLTRLYDSLVDFSRERTGKFTTAGKLYWHGESCLWKNELERPRNVEEAKIFLEMLVERMLAEKVLADLGGHNNNLSLYRLKV